MMSLDGSRIEKVTAPDLFKGPVHFSTLKEMALSPAHHRAAVIASSSFEATRDMRVGTIVHELVLGKHRTKPCILYDGAERKGNAWKDFEREAKAKDPRCEIVTAKEWEDAEPIAAAILADPVARTFLDGSRREVALQWESGGIACETDGIDIVGKISPAMLAVFPELRPGDVGKGFIGDLKRTSCTEPGGFSRHAAKHLWHAQLAFYEEACAKNGIDASAGLFLLGVEPYEPYACTVMRLSPATVGHGTKCYIRWLEALRVARENNHWPAYTQTVVPFDLPAWYGEEGGDE